MSKHFRKTIEINEHSQEYENSESSEEIDDKDNQEDYADDDQEDDDDENDEIIIDYNLDDFNDHNLMTNNNNNVNENKKTKSETKPFEQSPHLKHSSDNSFDQEEEINNKDNINQKPIILNTQEHEDLSPREVFNPKINI